MNKHDSLHILFKTLTDTLPYEYDEKYANGVGPEGTITISKNDTGHTIYITENTPDDNGVFDVALYDDILDDDPTDITTWDANDPNLTLTDLISYIEKSL